MILPNSLEQTGHRQQVRAQTHSQSGLRSVEPQPSFPSLDGLTTPRENPSRKQSASQGRVLLLENDRDARATLGGYLQQIGYRVTPAKHAREAMRMLEQYPGAFSLVCMTMDIPKARSAGLVGKIRSLQTKSYIPILLTTNMHDEVLLEQLLGMGADEFLAKPIHTVDLKVRVRNIQRIRRVENEYKPKCDRHHHDLEAARELQMSLVPKSPMKAEGVQVGWRYEPQGYVGGDMLDVFELDKDVYGMYVADVCGHGPAAAMMSVWLRHTLRPVSQESLSVRQTHQALHTMMLRPEYTCAFLENRLSDAEHERYLTMVYAVLDVQSRRLVWSRCGHPYPIYLSNSKNAELLLQSGGPAIGMGLGLPFNENVMELEEGDRVFFYSDGLIEAENAEGEAFGVKRCLDILDATRDFPLQQQIDCLYQQVSVFAGKEELGDDVTIMGIELDTKKNECRQVVRGFNRF